GELDPVLGAFDRGEIVRGYPMRGTVFAVAADTLAWLTQLCAAGPIRAATKRRPALGLEDAHVVRAEEVLEDVAAEHSTPGAGRDLAGRRDSYRSGARVPPAHPPDLHRHRRLRALARERDRRGAGPDLAAGRFRPRRELQRWGGRRVRRTRAALLHQSRPCLGAGSRLEAEAADAPHPVRAAADRGARAGRVG